MLFAVNRGDQLASFVRDLVRNALGKHVFVEDSRSHWSRSPCRHAFCYYTSRCFWSGNRVKSSSRIYLKPSA